MMFRGWVMMMLMMMMMSDGGKCVVGKVPDIKENLQNAKLLENFLSEKPFPGMLVQILELTCELVNKNIKSTLRYIRGRNSRQASR